MKILHTPPRFSPYIGGVEKSVYYLSRELKNRGHQVKIICANEPQVGNGSIEGIEVERLGYIGKVANTNITLGLAKALLKTDFDIIHTHIPTPWSADISALMSLVKHKPFFVTYHNDITGEGIYNLIAKAYTTSFLHGVLARSRRIFISHERYGRVSVFLKPYLKKIVVAPLGVAGEKFKPLEVKKNDTNIIFFLSRLDKFHEYKGLRYLLNALKLVGEGFPFKLYVGGGGELFGYYQALAKENGLQDSVNFLGFLDDKELAYYYNLCDVFVLPSTSSIQEGFGLGALEAMACRKPVIVTDVVGIADEIREGDAGVVVEPKNAQALAEALESLLLNQDARARCADNAYRIVREKYTWERHASIIEAEYLLAL